MNKKNKAVPYTVFAEVYDEYMNNIPYDIWVKNICSILSKHNITGGIVVELGCGTGTFTRKLASAGYDMIGIDISEDMLMIAREHESDGILYLNQDMREIELYGTVGAFVSVCDSMNYLSDVSSLTEVLKKTNLYLEKDGLFIFDMKTEHMYRDILGDTVQYEDNEDSAIIWENHYDEKTGIHSYDLTLFIGFEENKEMLYEKYKETHYQKSFSCEEVKKAVKDAGMELVGIADADTLGKPDETTERIYYIVKECYQEGKYYGD